MALTCEADDGAAHSQFLVIRVRADDEDVCHEPMVWLPPGPALIWPVFRAGWLFDSVAAEEQAEEYTVGFELCDDDGIGDPRCEEPARPEGIAEFIDE